VRKVSPNFRVADHTPGGRRLHISGYRVIRPSDGASPEVAQLTPEGEVFYGEAVRTLAQAEFALTTAKRAARGEVGRLSIGFIGSATYAFFPELVRKYKAQHPGVKLTLQELSPLQQEAAFERGLIDLGFTRTSIRSRAFVATPAFLPGWRMNRI
jgi:DNA-binding transcriptional LysR family regulator